MNPTARGPRKSAPWHDAVPGTKLPRRIDTIKRRHYQISDAQLAREIAVLRRFCAGELLKQIAGTMNLRHQVVSYCIGRVMLRAKVKTHAQLGAWAQREGLLESESRPGATPNSGPITRTGAAAAAEGAGL